MAKGPLSFSLIALLAPVLRPSTALAVKLLDAGFVRRSVLRAGEEITLLA